MGSQDGMAVVIVVIAALPLLGIAMLFDYGIKFWHKHVLHSEAPVCGGFHQIHVFACYTTTATIVCVLYGAVLLIGFGIFLFYKKKEWDAQEAKNAAELATKAERRRKLNILLATVPSQTGT